MAIPATLTPAQLAHYRTEGYLILRHADYPDLVDPALLALHATQVQSFPKEHGKWMPYEEINTEGQRQLMRTENFVDYHPGFHQLLRGDGLGSVLGQLAGEHMLLFKDKINYKSARGNGFAAHLDAPAYDHIKPDVAHLTANIAVDPASLENGCLEVCAGSHRAPVPLVGGHENGRIDPAWEAEAAWIPVPLAPGDVLFFGSRLAHRSGANASGMPRRMVYATYAPRADGEDLRERYYKHRRENFPPEHERVAGKDYGDGWRTYGFAAPFSRGAMEKSAAASAPTAAAAAS